MVSRVPMGAGGLFSTKTAAASHTRTWPGLVLVLLLLSLQVLAPGLGMTSHDHYDLIHDTHDLMFGFLSPASRRHKRTALRPATNPEDERFLGNELESLLDRSYLFSLDPLTLPYLHHITLRPREAPETKHGVSVDVARAMLHGPDGSLSAECHLDYPCFTRRPIPPCPTTNSAPTGEDGPDLCSA
ncbi:uncharacterized protein B0I36DRAFT_48914 [Microdochium trichocladiopsis]|uniref:Uncharacterized protein n=1 Tax=Microdochium trichocladiopsis TaxID=1682393 RepID=A0A9P9BLM7_9PEZI|nr:uncharacterized protein B0I36DRAFT_48914 [Microdochium trichocladiopsis]KAH7014252.1 hypothetical protein B0I36DRAFT_48914 [Microdochium trichocladiopsis]